MPLVSCDALSPKLSICIATYNRHSALRVTLQRLLSQITNSEHQCECEIVVSDNASSDATREVALEAGRNFPDLRYVRQETNIGWERNFNAAVEAANGEYCWLMPDDDLLKPGAIARVMRTLKTAPSLLIANSDYVDMDDASIALEGPGMDFEEDRIYEPCEIDRCFNETGLHVRYVGSVVIKRSIWLERMREEYYGLWFPQIGVIFQRPLPDRAVALADVLISVTVGRQFWRSSSFEVFLHGWPAIIQLLGISKDIKARIYKGRMSLKSLMIMRAWGSYSLVEYRKWIQPQRISFCDGLIALGVAVLPGLLLNVCCFLYFFVKFRTSKNISVRGGIMFRYLKESPYYLGRYLDKR